MQKAALLFAVVITFGVVPEVLAWDLLPAFINPGPAEVLRLHNEKVRAEAGVDAEQRRKESNVDATRKMLREDNLIQNAGKPVTTYTRVAPSGAVGGHDQTKGVVGGVDAAKLRAALERKRKRESALQPGN